MSNGLSGKRCTGFCPHLGRWRRLAGSTATSRGCSRSERWSCILSTGRTLSPCSLSRMRWPRRMRGTKSSSGRFDGNGWTNGCQFTRLVTNRDEGSQMSHSVEGSIVREYRGRFFGLVMYSAGKVCAHDGHPRALHQNPLMMVHQSRTETGLRLRTTIWLSGPGFVGI